MQALENNGKIITGILEKGKALPVLQALADAGVTRANFAYARGFDIHDPENPRKGFPDEDEKEILTVIAKDAAEGDRLFELVYTVGDMDYLGGGIVYMAKLGKASPYMLPEIQEAQQAAAASAAEVQA